MPLDLEKYKTLPGTHYPSAARIINGRLHITVDLSKDIEDSHYDVKSAMVHVLDAKGEMPCAIIGWPEINQAKNENGCWVDVEGIEL